MSKINFYFILILSIIPLLVYSQKINLDELLKAERITQSIVFNSEINFYKTYGFFQKKKEIALQQKSNDILTTKYELIKAQSNYYLFIVIALILLLIGSIYTYSKHVKGTNLILRQKNKLDELNATKDQLLTIVSHDLRSFVNALKKSNAQLTSSLETKNYNELDHLLHQNSSIANGAYRLLDNILHWALLQTKQLYFHLESVHLFSIIEQMEYDCKPLLLEKALIYENTVSKNCFIHVDIDSLKIIIRNLFDNAIKFSNKNGKIRMYTQTTNSNFCKLIIEDTGIGMNQNTVKELLKDGELLAKKNNSEIIGTGLGIQLCKQLIKKNGGKLEIESEPNKGARMILSFQKTKQNG